MNEETIEKVIALLQKELHRGELPIVSHLAEERRDAFIILISTLLSLRTKDEVTREATQRLLNLAKTPQEMVALPEETIAKTIYPVGFYKNKAKTIKEVCRHLIARHGGHVPDSLGELLALKGVGRKTANLVLTLGFGKDGICVDTHVHRISNRLGLVDTKTPEQTEFALREKLPRRYWRIYNTLMVTFGRRVCLPLSPFCSRCPIRNYCERRSVARSR